MASPIVMARAEAGWLRDSRFDLGFIVGTALVALASGATVVADPRLFPFILMLDLWLLGYHHVISTFTRLCFDRTSFQENRFLILHLPIIVLMGVAGVAAGLGVWALATIYLYWQWFHYTRQSWGILKAYRRKADGGMAQPAWFEPAALYLLPLWGILHRSWQQPEKFIGMDVWTIPVPAAAVDAVAAAALLALGLWSVQQVRLWRAGRLAIPVTLYMLSHLAVFATGYLLIDDITHGWLVINIWHNAQYVAFVWLHNNRRHGQRGVSASGLMATLSRTGNWPLYLFTCVAISTAAYVAITALGPSLALIGIPLIVVYQTINFHHYVVDSLIWKRRRIAQPDAAQSAA